MNRAGILNGRRVGIGFKTSPQGVEWQTMDAIWATAGEFDVFDSCWMNDHLSSTDRARGGPSLESLTLAAALAHRVPGKWVGHGVLSNTFRHPAVVAKAATLLDHVTGGQFILGLGAGWHEGEHSAYGIPLPPIRERIDRFTSAVRVLRALFSPEAASAEGVQLDDPFYPLDGATNEPGPIQSGGPPIWLGGQKTRGLNLAAAHANGWFAPGERAGDVQYLQEKRTDLIGRLEAVGRDPNDFAFVCLVLAKRSADERRAALATARAMVDAGATHVLIGIPIQDGPEALRLAAREIAEPLRDAVG